jgi:hypothetical protein
MYRALTALAVFAVLAAPAFAKDKDDKPHKDKVAGERMDSDRDRMRRNEPHMGLQAYPIYERRLGNRFYREGYRLTPREYRRWRASGFSADEVYLIANAANETGLEPSIFANAIYRGDYARQISSAYGIEPRRLTRVMSEWKSPEWAEATGEPATTKDRLNVWW